MNVHKNTLLKYLELGEPILPSELSYFSQSENLEPSWIEIDLGAIGAKLLAFILENEEQISDDEKAEWELKLAEMNRVERSETEAFFQQKIKGLKGISEIYESHLKERAYNFDWFIDGRAIPVYVIITLKNADRFRPRRIEALYYVKALNDYFLTDFTITTEDLRELKPLVEPFTLEKIGQLFNLYPQRSALNKYQEALEKTRLVQCEKGKQYKALGKGYQDIKQLGTSLVGDKVIIEETLEKSEGRFNNREFKRSSQLPFVRVFSLSKKDYFFVHVDDLQPYVYDKAAVDKLVLDQNNKEIITRIFESKKKPFSDLASNKGMGIIIMAVGGSGTGKTSTAEVYAERNEKPLYTMQVEEIGVDVKSVEKNLYTILQRIQSWQAVLLIDEADIFLSKRNRDLERSAIVGIFLRLLEYFEGVLFLTTNRLDVIDPAVLSRVTVVLNYPNLTQEVRSVIWQQNLRLANIKIDSLEALVKLELSGRDIRNYVKLIHYIFDHEVTESQVLALIQNHHK